MKNLRKELAKLWTGELAAVISFWICFYVVKECFTNTSMILSIIYPLIILSFILIQGSVYWWILLKRLSKPKFAEWNTRKIYSFLKATDIFLICLGLPVIFINSKNAVVMTLAIFIWIFAIIEWVNYYKIRLSYSYNPMILLRNIKNGTLKKSRLAKEIANR